MAKHRTRFFCRPVTAQRIERLLEYVYTRLVRRRGSIRGITGWALNKLIAFLETSGIFYRDRDGIVKRWDGNEETLRKAGY